VQGNDNEWPTRIKQRGAGDDLHKAKPTRIVSGRCSSTSGLDQGGEPVIPPRRHRKHQHRYDRIAYRLRWGIEGFSQSSNSGAALPARYDKLAATFLGFVKLASIILWLK
jgi:hypothetical protein